jgi:WD40 repeat protein/DNA-binding SARP family transcriptional activator
MADTTTQPERLRLRVLGPFEASSGGRPLAVRGSAARVLAVLAVTPGRVVTMSALIDALWAESPPSGAENAVQSYVSRLRRVLAPAGLDGVVATRSPGYVLEVEPDAVDAIRFARLAAEGRSALAAGQPELAAGRLGAALDLWHSEQGYAGVDDVALLDRERARLSLARLDAAEWWLTSRLDAGESVPVDEVLDLVVAHPHRERLRGLLMTALYRSGRQADALAAYREARDLFIEELGVEPGPELVEVHRAVLAQDPNLVAVQRAGSHLPPELEPRGPVFVGRTHELASLVEVLDVAACTGAQARWLVAPAGSGKTRLAAELAVLAAGRGAMVHYGRSSPAGSLLTLAVVDDLVATDASWLAERVRADGARPVLWLGLSHEDPVDSTPGAPVLRLPALALPAAAEIIAAYGGGLDAARAMTPADAHAEGVAQAQRRCLARIAALAGGSGVGGSKVGGSGVLPFGPEHDEIVDAVADLRRARALYAAHQPAAPSRAPYPGLVRFEAADEAYFHGRDRTVGQLVARLAQVQSGRLVAVVGPSGSGKSSLVRAGLLPLLDTGILSGSQRWRVLVGTPTSLGPGEWEEELRAGLVVVDQFEEVFVAFDEPGRRKFFDRLIDVVAHGSRVVLTLRSDLYGQIATHPGLAALVSANTLLLGPMSADEQRRAAEAPAEAAGLALEPGLVDRVLADLSGAAGALPLLAAALRATWERRTDRRLTVAGYERAAGVSGAIEQLGEAAYSRLSPDAQRAARSMLLRLVDHDGQGGLLRRRAQRSELDGVGGDEADAVIFALADRRLVTVDGDAVEVAHEAVLTHWPRLREWLDEDAAGRDLRGRLSPAAAEWAGSGRDPGQLWQGVRLSAALDWSDEHPGVLAPVEREFVAASAVAEAVQRERDRRANRRLRTLLAAVASLLAVALASGVLAFVQRDRADAASTVADARRLGAQAMTERDVRRGMLLAVAATHLDDSWSTRGALFASLLRNPELVAAGGESAGDRLLGMALSPDGASLVTTSFAGQVRVYDAATLHLVRTMDRAGVQPMYGAAFVPGGRLVGWGRGGPSGGVAVWDVATGRRVGGPVGPADLVVAAVPPGGRALIGLRGDGSVSRWDLPAGASPTFAEAAPLAPAGAGQHIVLSADDRFAAVLGGADPAVIDTTTGASWPLPGEAGDVVAVGADGATVLASGPDRTALQLWRRVDGRFRLVGTGIGHTASVLSAAWSPDGKQIVSCGDDHRVLRWDATTLLPIDVYTGHSGRVLSCVFSPDQRTIFSASLDGAVLAWDTTATRGLATTVRPADPGAGYDQGLLIADGRRLLALAGDRVQVLDPGTGADVGPTVDLGGSPEDIAADVGSDRYAVAFDDGRAQVWSATTGRPVGPEVHLAGGSAAVALSSDGSRVALGLDPGTVQVFDAATGAPIGPTIAAGDLLQCLAFSPNGRFLAAGHHDGRVSVYDLGSARQVADFAASPPEFPIVTVRFSPGGDLLAAGGIQGRPSVWRTNTWDEAWKADDGHTGYDLSLRFSPDGQIMASSGTDAQTLLYAADTGTLIGTSFGPADNIWTFSGFVPGGAVLVTFGQDGALRRWDVDPSSWVSRACAIAGRDLTPDEWRDLLPGRPYRSTCADRAR